MRDEIHLQDQDKRLRFSVASSLADILALEGLATEALAESRFSRAKFSKDKFVRAAERAAKDPNRHGVLVSSRNEKPVGFAVCIIGEPMVGTDLLITTVQVFYVNAAIRASLLGGKIANGLRLARESYVRELKDARLRHVYISLNGADNDDWYEAIDNLRCAEKNLPLSATWWRTE